MRLRFVHSNQWIVLDYNLILGQPGDQLLSNTLVIAEQVPGMCCPTDTLRTIAYKKNRNNDNIPFLWNLHPHLGPAVPCVHLLSAGLIVTTDVTEQLNFGCVRCCDVCA